MSKTEKIKDCCPIPKAMLVKGRLSVIATRANVTLKNIEKEKGDYSPEEKSKAWKEANRLYNEIDLPKARLEHEKCLKTVESVKKDVAKKTEEKVKAETD